MADALRTAGWVGAAILYVGIGFGIHVAMAQKHQDRCGKVWDVSLGTTLLVWPVAVVGALTASAIYSGGSGPSACDP